MIKTALIISRDTGVAEQIQRTIPADIHVHVAEDLPTALTGTLKQLDLIFLDVAPLQDNLQDEIDKIRRHFKDYNPMVQIVTLAPRDLVRRAVEVVNQGASNYLTYPVEEAEIQLVLTSARENISQTLELEYLRNRFWKPKWQQFIRTDNQRMHKVFENVYSAAPTFATILLLGETGTGKGLMARLIHRHSHRGQGPFVTVHCGAIPDTLLESELFGHEKAAFTGAVRRKFGKFELARNGTIFLDEIGTISAAAQVKLLQVLQDGTFSRVGGTEQLHANARIIAATNANLEEMTLAGQFRKDLFYRLNIFPIELPALRERIEDLSYLINLFLAKLNERYHKNIEGLYPGMLDLLQAYEWPGNLRELENVLERAIILESANILHPEQFPSALICGSRKDLTVMKNKELPLADFRKMMTEKHELQYLIRILTRHNGQVGPAAQEADISTRQLNRLIVKHAIDRKNFGRPLE